MVKEALRLNEALALMDVRTLDHVIVADSEHHVLCRTWLDLNLGPRPLFCCVERFLLVSLWL